VPKKEKQKKHEIIINKFINIKHEKPLEGRGEAWQNRGGVSSRNA